jgi:hypothetical protein
MSSKKNVLDFTNEDDDIETAGPMYDFEPTEDTNENDDVIYEPENPSQKNRLGMKDSPDLEDDQQMIPKGRNYSRADELEEICVYSFDPGTTNFAITKLVAKINPKDPTEYHGVDMEWFEVIQVKYTSEEACRLKDKTKIRDDDQITKAMWWELENGKLKKICTEYEELLKTKPTRKLMIMVESQMDHISLGGYRQPILYALYHDIHTFFLTKYKEKLSFIRWRGHDKSGLEDTTKNARKKATIPTAISFLEQEGFTSTAASIRALKKPKPAQDVADTYNQARAFLLNYLSSLGFSISSSSNIDDSARIQKNISKSKISHEMTLEKQVEQDENNNQEEDETDELFDFEGKFEKKARKRLRESYTDTNIYPPVRVPLPKTKKQKIDKDGPPVKKKKPTTTTTTTTTSSKTTKPPKKKPVKPAKTIDIVTGM